MNDIFCFIAAVIALSCQAQAFNSPSVLWIGVKSSPRDHRQILCAENNVQDTAVPNDDTSIASSEKLERASLLKRELYQLAASYDRGFSATPRARKEASDIIQKLAAINPTEDASRGIDGSTNQHDVPLKSIWRMIWTSALDVVSLGASPFAGEFACSYHASHHYFHSNQLSCSDLSTLSTSSSTECYIPSDNRPTNRHKCN